MPKHTRLIVSITILSALLFLGTTALAESKPSPKTYTVSIKGFKFIPDKLEVNTGDTIVWKNEDIVPHIILADKIRGKSMDQGESWTYKAREKGDFPYICRFHPTMKADLVVH